MVENVETGLRDGHKATCRRDVVDQEAEARHCQVGGAEAERNEVGEGGQREE